MNIYRIVVGLLWAMGAATAMAEPRVWKETTGNYTLEAELVLFNEKTVVLRRENQELVSIPLEVLSEEDREYLKSREALSINQHHNSRMQTWRLRDGTQIKGNVVDFVQRDVTLQRRRGVFYANDRKLNTLPEFYQQLLPKIVAHFEDLRSVDTQGLQDWMIRQRGQPREFHLEGVIFELENGDEYAVPFFLLSESDERSLQPGWREWKEAHQGNDYERKEDTAFLLESLAAARAEDAATMQRIAKMQFKMQAVQAGVTSLFEVALFPAEGTVGWPLSVVIPARDSREASFAAMQQNPGFVVGPVRRVNNR